MSIYTCPTCSVSLSLPFSLSNTHIFVYVIFQVIEKAGDKGIWTRDIKNQTNIQQQVLVWVSHVTTYYTLWRRLLIVVVGIYNLPPQSLNKALKILEQRNLVKTVKSVTSRSKKLYILADIGKLVTISSFSYSTDVVVLDIFSPSEAKKCKRHKSFSLLCMLIMCTCSSIYHVVITYPSPYIIPTINWPPTLEPNKDITGGPWYTDQEFDHAFIEVGFIGATTRLL